MPDLGSGNDSSSTRTYYVSGRVQGVGFRWYTREQAVGLGLDGWVRNLPDGRVEVVARGRPEDLAELEEKLRQGPRHAIVDNVEIAEVLPETAIGKSFYIK